MSPTSLMALKKGIMRVSLITHWENLKPRPQACHVKLPRPAHSSTILTPSFMGACFKMLGASMTFDPGKLKETIFVLLDAPGWLESCDCVVSDLLRGEFVADGAAECLVKVRSVEFADKNARVFSEDEPGQGTIVRLTRSDSPVACHQDVLPCLRLPRTKQCRVAPET